MRFYFGLRLLLRQLPRIEGGCIMVATIVGIFVERERVFESGLAYERKRRTDLDSKFPR